MLVVKLFFSVKNMQKKIEEKIDSLQKKTVSRRSFLLIILLGLWAVLKGFNRLFSPKFKRIQQDNIKTPERVSYSPCVLMCQGDLYPLVARYNGAKPYKLQANNKHVLAKGVPPKVQAVFDSLFLDQRLEYYQLYKDNLRAKIEKMSQQIKYNHSRGYETIVFMRPVYSPAMGAMLRLLESKVRGLKICCYELGSLVDFQWAKVMAYGNSGDPGVHNLGSWDIGSAKVVVNLGGDFLGVDSYSAHWKELWLDLEQRPELFNIQALTNQTSRYGDVNVSLEADALQALGLALAQFFYSRSARYKSIRGFERVKLKDKLSTHTLKKFVRNYPSLQKVVLGLVRKISNNIGKTVFMVSPLASYELQLVVEFLNYIVMAPRDINHGSSYTTYPLVEQSYLRSMVRTMFSGKVKTFINLNCDPFNDLPKAYGLEAAVSKVDQVIDISVSKNSVTDKANLQMPCCHELESWKDQMGEDELISLSQPLITALGSSHSEYELLLSGFKDWLPSEVKTNDVISMEQVLFLHYSKLLPSDWDYLRFKKQALDSSYSFDRAPRERERVFNVQALIDVAFGFDYHQSLSLSLLPHMHLQDGRYGDLPGLWEMPDSVYGVSWGNFVVMSPKCAKMYGVTSYANIVNKEQGVELTLPVVIDKDAADRQITAYWGDRRAGRSVLDLLGKEAGLIGYVNHQVELRPATKGLELADHNLELSHNQTSVSEVLSPVGMGQFEKWRKEWSQDKAHWAMVIDIDQCDGCGYCIDSCRHENNITPVGPEEINKKRSLDWLQILKIDGWALPIMCQQCDNAPCERLCPTRSSSHSVSLGINQQNYNRCLGARYCSVNCPYQARHFNWLDYRSYLRGTKFDVNVLQKPLLSQLYNQQVQMRGRGVMEKCNFCVQRLVQEGSNVMVPACGEVCPQQAIKLVNIKQSLELNQALEQGHLYVLGDPSYLPKVFYQTKKDLKEL